jgi:asparagine synthase (glutamine-hydrolysing)
VPKRIVDRPKHGLSTPYDSWLRESLGEEVSRRYSGESALGELVDPGTVSGLVAAHRSGRADHKSILYCLLELSEWHRAYLEGPRAALAAEATGG